MIWTPQQGWAHAATIQQRLAGIGSHGRDPDFQSVLSRHDQPPVTWDDVGLDDPLFTEEIRLVSY